MQPGFAPARAGDRMDSGARPRRPAERVVLLAGLLTSPREIVDQRKRRSAPNLPRTAGKLFHIARRLL